ncbi:MAG: alpha-2-macroglobulin, partial [Variovorax sp.]
RWVFDFAADLPPGMRCTVERVAGFRSASGMELKAPERTLFTTGGPAVRTLWPSYGKIDERQTFVFELNGAATLASVRENVWCAADGPGERIPTVPVEGTERDAALQAVGRDKPARAEPLRFATLRCNRTLTAGGRVQLVYGKGVATPSGVVNAVERRFDFEVREPFAATFGCERENAQAACLPLRPMTLRFNAPVTRALAAQVRLEGAGAAREPVLDDESAAGGDDAVVDSIAFAAPFPEHATFSVVLPAGMRDAAGRPLAAPAGFPLAVATGAMPPLAKFAASPFGVVERLAEPGGVALMPVTVRRVEPALQVSALTPGRVGDLSPTTDAEIIAWMRKVQRYEQNATIDRGTAARDVREPLPRAIDKEERDAVQTRTVSLLAGRPEARTLDMPRAEGGDPRPFEVVGIPLAPGFHVLEIASRRLGDALLDARHGDGRTMYVRTTALATNLAVHFKLGRENALAWVTTLDKGAVVPNAAVRVSDCRGREVARGTTDARGIATLTGIASEAPACAAEGDGYEGEAAYFVSARATLPAAPAARGAAAGPAVEDLAFTWSHWQRGIEPWRFNVPTSFAPEPDRVAHTVFDRTLLRAGETVSMKHLMRTQTARGLGVADDLPDTLVVTHTGSGTRFTQDVAWRKTPTGGRSAQSTFTVPPAAKLGLYEVELRHGKGRAGAGGDIDPDAGRAYATGRFRVEEFRLPVFEGRVGPSGKPPLVGVASLPVDVRIGYVAGGGAANLPVRVSAMVRGKSLDFPDHDGFSFSAPRKREEASSSAADADEEAGAADDTRVVADKLPLVLDRDGAGRVTIDKLPPAEAAPRELLIEATYADPNGEVQTIRGTHTLWPADVVAGLKTEGWVSVGRRLAVQAIALDLDGRPRAGVKLQVDAVARITTTSRKRMVGGFYTYDSHTDVKDLGRVCGGTSDARGLLACTADLQEAGEVELVVTATDKDGRASRAAGTVYVTKQGELWFGGEDHDRIDVLPEKKTYQPGETAKFQVRSPFRFATALVAVEREGVIETHVVQLDGQDPTVTLQVKPEWGPNTYVSVLALRGRLREVPWYSFFTWGFKAPREWWTAFRHEGREYVAPTALVDLSKPAYRFGVAEIRVGTQAHRIDVKVASDRPTYPVRGKAQVTVSATLPDGRPAAGAEVALAAVDQALLELMPNDSWNLLEAMLQRRAWGVSTSTAQMEIVGRRHYGKKAVPAGGGGGRSPTRELLDTLLLWNPAVVLDAQGKAVVTVPLNDALTTFRIVAVADAGTGLFGTGQTTIQATQDLQIISGLPPLVREEDRFRAQVTLRNTTPKAMRVEVAPRATLLALAARTLDVPAGESRVAAWDVTAPAQLAQTRAEAILWEIEARDTLGGQDGARDALKVSQRIVPAVPLAVQQATLVQIGDGANGGDDAFSLDVAPPADALPSRGGLRMALVPRLAEGLPGVRDWFAAYPFSCLEQKTSKAIGLRDVAMWRGVVAQLPTYLDADGLANYFPPRDGQADRGSDILTSYLLAATHEAGDIDPAFALPEAVRAPMEAGLIAFVEGRIQREFWSPRKDLDVRKLAALEALSRHGKARAGMLASIAVAPDQWPTGAVVDWLQILQRLPDAPQRRQRLDEAGNVLRARLSYQGTRLVFSTERDDQWWWLMTNGDVNAARLLLATMDDPAWKDDMGRLAGGLIGRQRNGAWQTTTANLWGGLALERFSRTFEREPVGGTTTATLRPPAGGADTAPARTASVDWARVERVKATDAAGASRQDGTSGGNLRNNTMFLPWATPPARQTLNVAQNGGGRPWLTLQSVAAVPLKAPFSAGYAIRRTVTPVEQAVPGRYTRGDVLRVTLEVDAAADMTWVAITDPVPAGATILGGGLGRDSQIATQGEKTSGRGMPAFEERSFEAFRSYYEFLPKGTVKMAYTVRLNNAGDFALPPSRVEALYAPEMFGELPNARMAVGEPR